MSRPRLRPGAGGRPIPTPTPLSRPYWDACREGRLTFLRCENCGLALFPPEGACTTCQSDRLTWEDSSGRGTLYSYTVLHSPPSAGFPEQAVFAIVELVEGYSMFSNVVACARDDIRIGMELRVAFEQVSDDIHLPVFEPAANEENP